MFAAVVAGGKFIPNAFLLFWRCPFLFLKGISSTANFHPNSFVGFAT